MTKIDMPLSYVDEAKKINELLYKKNLTTTGQATFTSESSRDSYDTNAEIHIEEADIYNCGELGLLKLLIKSFSGENGGWILTAEDLNNKSDKNHKHGNIENDGTIGTESGLAIKTGTDGKLETGILSVKGGGTGVASFIKGNLLLGNDNGAIQGLSGKGALFAQTENNPNFGTLPVEFGGTGKTSLASFREALGLGSSTGALPVENGGTGVTTLQALRNALGLGNTTGALPVSSGGTGVTTLQALRNALGLGNTTDALPIANGGTGATTAATARNALGLGNTTGALPIANGGTGGTNKSTARTNLGITSGTSSPSGGENGDIYIQYS